jgi:hypothetical protein
MVGNYIHMFMLYLCFSVMTIIISGLGGLATQVFGGVAFIAGIFQCLLIVVAGFAAVRMSKTAPKFFSAKNEVNYQQFNQQGKMMVQKGKQGSAFVKQQSKAAGN